MRKITEVEKPEVKALIVTGYPRNLKDIVEYTSSSRKPNVAGVILLDWVQQKINQQMERAVEIGHINAELAQVESRSKDLLDMIHFLRDKGKLSVVSLC